MMAVIDSSVKSTGNSKPSSGHTQVHLSSGRVGASDRWHSGLPLEQTGQLQVPHAYKSKMPFVHPNES